MASETQAAAGYAADVAEKGGLPQLDFSTFSNQIFWLLVSLVVIYFILSKIAMPRIAGILSERHGRITSDLAAAEDFKAQVEQAEESYQQALADARTEANVIVADAKNQIKKQLDAATAEADVRIAERTAESEARISEIRAEAMSSVETISHDITSELVSALGGKADAKTIKAAVAARLKG